MGPRWLSLVVTAALVLGCHGSAAEKKGQGSAGPGKSAAPGKSDVVVFAAASLRESFDELAQELERIHPEAHVIVSFAGSQALRAQIEQGAPADVFASADQKHMSALVGERQVESPHVFATNELVVVVAKAKGDALRELRALPEATRIVLGAPEVPVGAYTQQMLDKAGKDFGADFRARVEAHVVSREPDVRQVLAKVKLGEADAGVVYRTDAMTAKDEVRTLDIPIQYNVVAEYPVAVTTHAHAPELGRAFVALLMSAEGARVLKARGFTPLGERAAQP